MTKNKMSDLNDHLFAQMERLTDEDLTEEELEREINRSREVTRLSKAIIANGTLVLQAARFTDSKFDADIQLPKMLGGDIDASKNS